jgi:hypothetical protein
VSAVPESLPPTYADVNRDVERTLLPPGNLYFAWMCVVGLILTGGILAWTYQIWFGMGAAGKRTPQMWAMYITTFVFWIGIGHAGTLISAVLYLFRANWRTSIYRAAEAMTIFAVLTAGLFPLIHAGRMWFAYFLLPYANQRYLWPNFKSPLVWDVFAISTYLSISTVFFITGLARHRGPARQFHGLAAANLRHAVPRVGGRRFAVATLPPGLRTPGGPGHPARPLGAQRGVLGLRHGPRAGLALHPLRSLLRRRGHLLGLCHGGGAGAPHAPLFSPASVCDRPTRGLHRQADSRDRTGPHLLLSVRDLHRLV